MKYIMAFACLFLFLFSSVALSAEKVVRFSEDPWPPYTLGESGKSPHGGIAVDVIHDIFKRVGVKTEMTLYPWKRCLQQMRDGERDALMMLGYSKEREDYLIYSDMLINVRDLIYFNVSLPMDDWKTMDDFKELIFARPHGFQFGEEFEKAVVERGIRIYPVKSDIQAFKMLADGRVDAVICNEITARTIFKEFPDVEENIKVAVRPLKNAPLYMAFSKKSPHKDLMGQVNRAIREMRAEGALESIVDSYFE